MTKIYTGSRKNAHCRLNLRSGNGQFWINQQTYEAYFCQNQIAMLQCVSLPSRLLECAQSVDVNVRVHGGGKVSQAYAVRLALARALADQKHFYRRVLKPQGVLTRDPRKKERKKCGLKKARKAGQYSKR